MNMTFPENQIEELKKIVPSISYAEEGGYTYILLENLNLPEGCVPSGINALLCPSPREGYASRLFFESMITVCPQRNWNGRIRVLERNWFAISWQVPSNLRLAEILLVHLKALRNEN